MGLLRTGGAAIAACLALLAAVPAAHAREIVAVGNLRDGTVSIVDQTALTTLGSLNVIPDGTTPQDPVQALAYPVIVGQKGLNYIEGIGFSPDGRTLYVSRGWLGDVIAFDIASRSIRWRVQISGIRADHLAVSPDGSRLFVSALTSDIVEVFDTASHRLIGVIPTGDWPHVDGFTPHGSLLVNGSLGNQLVPGGVPTRFQMTFADPRTLAVKRTLSFSAGVRPFVFAPDGNTAYVQFSFYNGFKVIDAVTGATLHEVPLPLAGPAVGEPPSAYPNQAAHHGIDVSYGGTRVCDAATVSNYVAIVSTTDYSVVGQATVGDQPADALTSYDGSYCFVSNRGIGPGGNTLSVISYADGHEVKRLPMSAGPQELAAADVPDAVLQAAGL